MIRKAVKAFVRNFGYDLVRHEEGKHRLFPIDFQERHIGIINQVKSYTITSYERMHALIESVRYVAHNKVKGALVECGVYKGGSMMAVALTLMMEGVTDRDLYLFDTFEGMPAPDERDRDLWDTPASQEFAKTRISDVSSTWTKVSMEDVRKAMALTGYPMERIHFVKGLVEDTLPQHAPESIALLRLDTDWYRSTIHELNHLYPRLSPKGVFITDDYGHFKGAREAIDEYFLKNKMAPLMHRIDYTGRMIIKEG